MAERGRKRRNVVWTALAVAGGLAAVVWPAHAEGILAQAPRQPPLVAGLGALLSDPNVAYLLFVLGLLGLIGEAVTAGTLVPGTIGAVCLVLAMIGLGNLPTNWGGALLIILAVTLFLFDLKLPGHGLSIGGIVIFGLGSILLFTPFWVSPSPETEVRLNPWLAAAMTAGVGGFFLLGVAAALRARRAPLAVGRETVIGKVGTVRRALDPAGIVHIEGEDWSAVAAGGSAVPAGATVRVLRAEGLTLEVETLGQNETGGSDA